MSTRRCLVTGCASGIGRALVSDLLADGAEVVATDVHAEGLQRARREDGWATDRIDCRALDVTSRAAWTEVVDDVERHLGPIDALINVAGYLRPGWVHEVDAEVSERHIDVNFKGVVLGTREVAAKMVARGRGHIVNVASMAALAPVPGIAIYSATKYAVRGFSLAAAQELEPRGVRVTVVCPDACRTPMLDLQRDYEEAVLTFSGNRELEPGEVTSAIVRALTTAPLEVYLPFHRAMLARFGDLFPRSTFWLAPLLRRTGRRNQQKRK